ASFDDPSMAGPNDALFTFKQALFGQKQHVPETPLGHVSGFAVPDTWEEIGEILSGQKAPRTPT
ncbi:hypothetical protein ACYT69_12500, partial [Streptococcus pyogenes]